MMFISWSIITGCGWYASNKGRAVGMLHPTPPGSSPRRWLPLLTVVLQLLGLSFFALSGLPDAFPSIAGLSLLAFVFVIHAIGHTVFSWVCLFDAEVCRGLIRPTDFTKRNKATCSILHALLAGLSLTSAVIILTLVISGGSWPTGGGRGGDDDDGESGGGLLPPWKPGPAGIVLALLLLGWSGLAYMASGVNRKLRPLGMLHPVGEGGQPGMFALISITANLAAWVVVALCGFEDAMSRTTARGLLAALLILNGIAHLLCAWVCHVERPFWVLSPTSFTKGHRRGSVFTHMVCAFTWFGAATVVLMYLIEADFAAGSDPNFNFDGIPPWKPDVAGIMLALLLVGWSGITCLAIFVELSRRQLGMLHPICEGAVRRVGDPTSQPTGKHAGFLFFMTVTLQCGAWVVFVLCGFENVLARGTTRGLLASLLIFNGIVHMVCAWVCQVDKPFWVLGATLFTRRHRVPSVVAHIVCGAFWFVSGIMVLILIVRSNGGGGGGGGGGGLYVAPWKPRVTGILLSLLLLGWSAVAALATYVNQDPAEFRPMGMLHRVGEAGQHAGLAALTIALFFIGWVNLALCGFEDAMSRTTARGLLAALLILNGIAHLLCAWVCQVERPFWVLSPTSFTKSHRCASVGAHVACAFTWFGLAALVIVLMAVIGSGGESGSGLPPPLYLPPWEPTLLGNILLGLLLLGWSALSFLATWVDVTRRPCGMLHPQAGERKHGRLIVLGVVAGLLGFILFVLCGFKTVIARKTTLALLGSVILVNSLVHVVCAWVCGADTSAWILRASPFTRRHRAFSSASHIACAFAWLALAMVCLIAHPHIRRDRFR